MQPDRVAEPPADDYDSILTAVMETARGRWFIAEFSRRNRQSETAGVLDALARIERKMAGGAFARSGAHPDLEDLAAIFALGREPGDGLTAELVAAVARDIGAAADTSRDHLLMARGALKGLAEGGPDQRLLAALDRALMAIDAAIAHQADSGRKVEALADIVESVRDRLRRFLGDLVKPSPIDLIPAAIEGIPARLADPVAAPPLDAAPETDWRPDPPSPANAPATVSQDHPAPAAFEGGLPIEPVAPGARIRLAMADDSEALRNLAVAAAEPRQPHRLPELDRMGYAERYALFAS